MSWTPVEVLQEAIVQRNIKIHRHRSSRFVWTMVRRTLHCEESRPVVGVGGQVCIEK